MNNITVHMVVKNEDQWIWFALKSILPYANEVLITDTGSTDNTLNLINSFSSEKINLEKTNISNPEDITKIRQHQLEKTQNPWIWLVDGDEIYPQQTAEEIASTVKKNKHKLIVVRRYNLLGDIYHRQVEKVGEYKLFGKKGHLVTRLFNQDKIKGLHTKGIYPYEGYFDQKGKSTRELDPKNVYFTKNYLYHTMYLKRSSVGANLKNVFHRNKFKIEKGIKIKFSVPKIFTQSRPEYVPDPLIKRSALYQLLALILTPIKKLKRKFL